MKPNVSRRRVVLSLFLAAGWLLRPHAGSSTQCVVTVSDKKILSRRLVQAIRHVDPARHIGEAYLKETPQAVSSDYLVEKICGSSTSVREQLMAKSCEQLKAWIYHRIRKDFQAGYVTLVDGWMLSDTEVHLCALITASGFTHIGRDLV